MQLPSIDYADHVARAGIVALLLVDVLAAGAPAASAAPAAVRRVVLADPDPELKHAMDQAFVPWHLEVVVEGAPQADAAEATERAGADTARFVVWRDGDQLVAYDRTQASMERRASRAGPLDPPTAAAQLAVDHHDARARDVLERYLRRFPGGANAPDAQLLLARLEATP